MFSKILLFIRDWLPSLAIIVGGSWVLWKYKISEKQRQKKEMPAITSKMSISVLDSTREHSFLAINSMWKNHSPMPVPLDTSKILVEVHSISLNVGPGFMKIPDDLGEPVHRGIPFGGYKKLVLEPETDSTFNAYMMLETGQMYLVRWTITEKAEDDNPYSWVSEKLVDLRPSI